MEIKLSNGTVLMYLYCKFLDTEPDVIWVNRGGRAIGGLGDVDRHGLGECTCSGVYLLGGCTCWGGVPAEGLYLLGVCTCPGIYLPGSVSQHALRQTSPREQNDWQMPVKILPYRNFVADGNNRFSPQIRLGSPGSDTACPCKKKIKKKSAPWAAVFYVWWPSV